MDAEAFEETLRRLERQLEGVTIDVVTGGASPRRATHEVARARGGHIGTGGGGVFLRIVQIRIAYWTQHTDANTPNQI